MCQRGPGWFRRKDSHLDCSSWPCLMFRREGQIDCQWRLRSVRDARIGSYLLWAESVSKVGRERFASGCRGRGPELVALFVFAGGMALAYLHFGSFPAERTDRPSSWSVWRWLPGRHLDGSYYSLRRIVGVEMHQQKSVRLTRFRLQVVPASQPCSKRKSSGVLTGRGWRCTDPTSP